jgi:FkbM family methyltransferase
MDLIINEQIFHNKRNGKYIEIGAGSEGNATKYFEKELGWSGVLIEPNPVLYESLVDQRPNNIIYKKVISNEPVVLFHSYHGSSSDMSAIEETVPDYIESVYYNNEIIIVEKKTIDEVETKSLMEIINQSFDFMFIDVNGHELEVLKSWDFSHNHNIHYIIFNKNNLNEKRFTECEELLKRNHYVSVDYITMNNSTYYVYNKEYVTRDSCIIC